MTRKQIIQILKQVRADATMQHASFRVGTEPAPFGAEVTDLVRVSTRLWRDTWLLAPLDEVIEALEGGL